MENAMKRLLIVAAAALTVLLTGCANPVRSNVTTFHQWPADLADKSYVIEAPPAQDDTLELRSYQNLVRAELAKLGFREAVTGTPALKVSMRFSTTDIPVRRLEAVDSPFFYPSSRFMFSSRFMYSPRYMYSSSFYRPYWGGRRYWGGGMYSPFYDPFWAPEYIETIRHVYRRELQVGIKTAAEGKHLFDVTVHNNSSELSTPALMPALVRSAFTGFPGESGKARRVKVVLDEEARG
jgi:hypothetical protein